MTSDIGLLPFKDDQDSTLSSAIVLQALKPFIRPVFDERFGEQWELVFPDGGGGEVDPIEEGKDENGLAIGHHSGFQLLDALYEIMRQTHTLLYWTGCETHGYRGRIDRGSPATGLCPDLRPAAPCPQRRGHCSGDREDLTVRNLNLIRIPFIFTICGIVLANLGSAAVAADPAVTAIIAPQVRAFPQLPPGADLGQQTLECPPDLCGIHIPEDLWKRDFLQKTRPTSLNADVIEIDRSRRKEMDNRFSETPVLATKIGNTSCLALFKILDTGSSLLRADLLTCGF